MESQPKKGFNIVMNVDENKYEWNSILNSEQLKEGKIEFLIESFFLCGTKSILGLKSQKKRDFFGISFLFRNARKKKLAGEEE